MIINFYVNIEIPRHLLSPIKCNVPCTHTLSSIACADVYNHITSRNPDHVSHVHVIQLILFWPEWHRNNIIIIVSDHN